MHQTFLLFTFLFYNVHLHQYCFKMSLGKVSKQNVCQYSIHELAQCITSLLNICTNFLPSFPQQIVQCSLVYEWWCSYMKQIHVLEKQQIHAHGLKV